MKNLFAVLILIFLTGCASNKAAKLYEPQTTVKVVTIEKKTKVPKITPPPEDKLEEFKFNKPDDPTNVAGLDNKNLKILKKNYSTLKAREQRWRNRINEANRLNESLSR